MVNILYLVSGGIGALIVVWIFRFWQHRQNKLRRRKAAAFLKKRGLTAQLYIPTIGIEDTDLLNAIDEFACSGHIIMNTKGEVLGKVSSRFVKKPPLRLVVFHE